jgi:hypothetical protein
MIKGIVCCSLMMIVVVAIYRYEDFIDVFLQIID